MQKVIVQTVQRMVLFLCDGKLPEEQMDKVRFNQLQ